MSFLMLHGGLLNTQSTQHVSGIIMPIIRSSTIYRWLQHVAQNALFKAARVVWCEAVECCKWSNIPQPGRIATAPHQTTRPALKR